MTTPGTRRTWTTAAEWIAHAVELKRRRGTRAKADRDAVAHLAALAPEWLHARRVAELHALRAAIAAGLPCDVPPRGARAGTAYEAALTTINDAIARGGGPPRWRPAR